MVEVLYIIQIFSNKYVSCVFFDSMKKQEERHPFMKLKRKMGFYTDISLLMLIIL